MKLDFSVAQAVLGLASTSSKNLTELFGPNLSQDAQIILPEQSQWRSQVQSRWTDYRAPNYLGAIKPATESDIQHTVQTASSNGIPFLATGGGHGVSDYSDFEGIAVDLGNFDSVHLDETKDLLTIGGAVKYSGIIDVLYNAGKELPLAACPCMGVVGATMGAGIGPLVGHRGLMLDALRSVRMITANGTMVTASESENSDLFWAVRGAGANFGVVTSATYKVYPITNEGRATTVDMVFPATANESFYDVLHSLDEDIPSRLALTTWASYNHTLQQSLIFLHAIYFGEKEEVLPVLEPFSEIGPTTTAVASVPQKDLYPGGFGACVPNQHILVYTLAVQKIHPPTFRYVFEELSKFSSQFEDYEGRFLIQRYGKDVVKSVPDSSAVYPWRDTIAHVNVESFYSNTSNDDAVNEFAQWARAQLVKESGYDHLATYMNFAHGDEGPAAWYSLRKLPKLMALKQFWDPKGLFSWHNAVTADVATPRVDEL